MKMILLAIFWEKKGMGGRKGGTSLLNTALMTIFLLIFILIFQVLLNNKRGEIKMERLMLALWSPYMLGHQAFLCEQKRSLIPSISISQAMQREIHAVNVIFSHICHCAFFKSF